MLYQRNRAGELPPMNEPKWHARRFVGNELLDIMNLLRNLIQQKGFDQNQIEFTASNLVGEHQIEWDENSILQAILIRYPISQNTQSTVLGRILFQTLLDDSNEYEFIKGRNAYRAKYRKL